MTLRKIDFRTRYGGCAICVPFINCHSGRTRLTAQTCPSVAVTDTDFTTPPHLPSGNLYFPVSCFTRFSRNPCRSFLFSSLHRTLYGSRRMRRGPLPARPGRMKGESQDWRRKIQKIGNTQLTGKYRETELNECLCRFR